MKNYNKNLFKYDFKIWKFLKNEIIRQEENIELIASENYINKYIMKIQGSQLTNKYAEGYPGKRYYAGCKYIDKIENLSIKRAKRLFKANYVNVQPHSGSQANFSVYNALLNPGDTILSIKLNHGGHLTHGSLVNISGKLYNFVHYKLNKKNNIDYNNILKISCKYSPKMIIGGFSSYSGLCNWKKIRFIANYTKSYLFADISHISGLIISNLYPNPILYAHIITTTTHKTLAGPRGGLILSKEKKNFFCKKINESVFPGIQGGPLMHIIAAKAMSFKEAVNSKFIVYQIQTIINSKLMSKIFISLGYKVISNITKNHLFLLDLKNKNITGNKIELKLEYANIIVNKNIIPNDKKKYFITSGIRIGTPAVTRRGFKEKEISILTLWIHDIIQNVNDFKKIFNIKKKVLKICKNFIIYK
ncbi:Serine hydroxymethyltransferase [Candidatus Annandia adelgestsuga]|uniref:Serine hydroxymethyltransferase n=1 Tax=Candidatus Annandia adelgestsuga TaxID=1302411 RepID=A0A3Q9CKV7_9ENTR|nr:serine hydroxymethyltransferase [Candidatus Annandia adelgestsuga]AZP36342.1 Serine hydroxymethyltransferase [Candidatus Annandia adelgestsuga]